MMRAESRDGGDVVTPAAPPEGTLESLAPRYDVVIVGAGLAGLSLARHLLLDTDKTILMIERQAQVPPKRQKVGESSVQVGGYYYSKVLDLEEHLMCSHFMKYNLRFFWGANGRDGAGYEDYGQSAIRPFSNIPSYQLDRNVFEGELLRRNLQNARFTLAANTRRLDIALADDGGVHRVSFRRASSHQAGSGEESDGGSQHSVEAGWVVDASGRNKVLSKRLGTRRKSPIRHGASFAWVDGLVDVEKLTARSRRANRLDPARAQLGHLPVWLATNHFMGEGFWFWVIPLQGKTSLGLVYDREMIDSKDVASAEKLLAWVIDRFPLMERDLQDRKVLDWWGYRDYAHDCGRTIHPTRWAMTGEAGRFSDPLYSPGSDLIAVHNTLIVDAIQTDSDAELEAKSRRYESLMRAVYEAYVPSYAVSYEVLGDQECFSMKYVWELTIYFGFYVFPFINDLLTENRFIIGYLRTFSRLGPLNTGIQKLLVDYYRWKKVNGTIGSDEPCHFDFMSVQSLAFAERAFYRVGVDIETARNVLRDQLTNVEELARYVLVFVASQVIGAPEAVNHARFVEEIGRLDAIAFEPDRWHHVWIRTSASKTRHHWNLDPEALAVFERQQVPHGEEVAV